MASTVISAVVGGGVGLGVAAVAAPIVLTAVGFGAGGIAAGSAAAAVQSTIGNVVAGSAFATLQSIGASGGLSLLAQGAAAVGGAAVGAILG